VKQILGLFSYSRLFVKDFAHIAKSLSDLTKKNLLEKITWTHWTDIHQKAFDALKEEIRKNMILSVFDVTKPFNLYCHSSDYAVGAVLTQQLWIWRSDFFD